MWPDWPLALRCECVLQPLVRHEVHATGRHVWDREWQLSIIPTHSYSLFHMTSSVQTNNIHGHTLQINQTVKSLWGLSVSLKSFLLQTPNYGFIPLCALKVCSYFFHTKSVCFLSERYFLIYDQTRNPESPLKEEVWSEFITVQTSVLGMSAYFTR